MTNLRPRGSPVRVMQWVAASGSGTPAPVPVVLAAEPSAFSATDCDSGIQAEGLGAGPGAAGGLPLLPPVIRRHGGPCPDRRGRAWGGGVPFPACLPARGVEGPRFPPEEGASPRSEQAGCLVSLASGSHSPGCTFWV